MIDVFPFIDKLGPMKSVPTTSVAMLATDDHGEEAIFVIHESLWFGHQMEHTLLSLNQLCANDVELWDNPCNQYHNLVIHNLSSNHPVPLAMDGIVCFMESRAPTDEEIRTLPHVELTSSVKRKHLEQLTIFICLARGTLVRSGKFLSLIPSKALLLKVLLLFLKVSSIWIPICGVLLSWASILFLAFQLFQQHVNNAFVAKL